MSVASKHRTAATSGLIKRASGDSKATPGWEFKNNQLNKILTKSDQAMQPQKVPGIGSGEAVGAGSGVGASVNPLPQLAAEAEGCRGAKGRYWAWDGGDELCLGPEVTCLSVFKWDINALI
jgi:hypothetical protein